MNGLVDTGPEEALQQTISFGDSNSGFQAGLITGPVTTVFNHHAPGMSVSCSRKPLSTDRILSKELPETPPSPLSICLPFGPDPDYVQRDSLLEEIRVKLARSRRAALVGIGGVG